MSNPSTERYRRPSNQKSGISGGTITLIVLLAVGIPLLLVCCVASVFLGFGFFGSFVALQSAADREAAQVAIAGAQANDPEMNFPEDGEGGIRPENEATNMPALVPIEVDPLLLGKDDKVYLSDMNEFAYIPGPPMWTFGKHGKLGSGWDRGAMIKVDGKIPQFGLSTHPPDIGYTRVCYAFGKKAKKLIGAAALSEDEGRGCQPTRMLILGDGKVLWRSRSLRKIGETDPFSLVVQQVQILELRAYTENNNNFGSHAVWVDPYVALK